MRVIHLLLCFVVVGFWTASGCAAGGETNSNGECTVGAEGCPCTQGGACDPGLSCLSDLCVSTADTTSAGGSGGDIGVGSGANGTGGMDCIPGHGCQAVDVVFALDSSGSMADENTALAATSAFKEIVEAIAAINCGQVDYRVGVTNDYNGGFIVPSGWPGSVPWFDSQSMSVDDIALAFTGAAQTVMSGSSTPVGCEHVLTTTTNLLQSDTTGFVREGALLVLVLVTDVDDYGAYDQVGGHACGAIGCNESPPAISALHSTLLAMKGGDQAALAAVVAAGDPNINGGQNICGQPGTCCAGTECSVFHGSRLWEFANLLGGNGLTHNLCQGAASLPTAVDDAFQNRIDLACQELEPPS